MFIVTLVSLSHSELVPFVYVYGMFVCLYSPDQNQMLAHDMINLLYCQGYVMAWNQ